jgi:hypothetical protein
VWRNAALNDAVGSWVAAAAVELVDVEDAL